MTERVSVAGSRPMVSQAASRRNVTFVIREGDLSHALGRLHRQFFAPEPAPAGLA